MSGPSPVENPLPYTPPKAALYQKVVQGLVVNSRNIKNFLQTMSPVLTPEPEAIQAAAELGGQVIGDTHPLDALPKEKKTPDVYALCNAFSRLESVHQTLPAEDIEVFGEHARLYSEYRMKVLEALLTETKEGKSEGFIRLQQQYQKIGVRLYELQNSKKERGEDFFGLYEEATCVFQLFTDLIRGQVETRLKSIGKESDPLLYDPTIERLKEEDIRAAVYQYDLLINAIFPLRTQETKPE